MDSSSDSPLDRLWAEYASVFRDFDDLTLARWMAQTLSQLEGRVWRLSHPLVGTYRLAAQHSHERQIWLKRLANAPVSYPESACCRAPLVPLLTRDVMESGLICQHCLATCVPFEEFPKGLTADVRAWAEEYAPVHAVAHWDDRQRRSVRDYDRAFEDAAKRAESLLALAGREILPRFLDDYPVILWEDQDDCLEVRPEDVQL